MTRDDIIRIAKQAGMAGMATTVVCEIAELERFAELVKADFLEKSGQYITNDASREASIKEAVEAEREACAMTSESLRKEPHGWNSFSYTAAANDIASAIRARGNP